jgi:protein-S-isoprenylcysteine O-methyltransferase Ste14
MRTLALIAILPAGATFYFYVFWRWFDYWRGHPIKAYLMMLGTFPALGAAVYHYRDFVLSSDIDLPDWVNAIGWAIIAGSCLLGVVADRQIGIWVRSFMPFFERRGRIRLKTTGAYRLVRHPIYASGIYFQLGVFLATGYPAVAVACAVFVLGALWFTRQEERRLVELLDDPAEYERYRDRVPALLPWIKSSRGSRGPRRA